MVMIRGVRHLGEGIQQLVGVPPHLFNAYLVDGVLVDACTPAASRRLLRQLKGAEVTAHLVTHAHPDHFGSSHAICESLKLPLWVGADDVKAIETATPVTGPGRIPALMSKMKMPPPHPVDRRCAKVTRSAVSPCWRCPVIRPGISRSGGRRTGP